MSEPTVDMDIYRAYCLILKAQWPVIGQIVEGNVSYVIFWNHKTHYSRFEYLILKPKDYPAAYPAKELSPTAQEKAIRMIKAYQNEHPETHKDDWLRNYKPKF